MPGAMAVKTVRDASGNAFDQRVWDVSGAGTGPFQPRPKSFGPIFRPTTPDASKTISKENLGKRFERLDKQLAGNDGR